MGAFERNLRARHRERLADGPRQLRNLYVIHIYTRTELGVVTDAMLDAITAELEEIRGEKAPEGRWNPRTKRREAPGTPSGPVGGALGEPDAK